MNASTSEISDSKILSRGMKKFDHHSSQDLYISSLFLHGDKEKSSLSFFISREVKSQYGSSESRCKDMKEKFFTMADILYKKGIFKNFYETFLTFIIKTDI